MADMTSEQFQEAQASGEARLSGPLAESAHYDAGRGRLIVRLAGGVEIGFPPALAEGLEHATAADLAVIEVDACGLGIHVPALDADLYVPALLEGVLGSERWMAARMGAKGGRARSAAKTAAVRENGRKGGRPQKAASG